MCIIKYIILNYNFLSTVHIDRLTLTCQYKEYSEKINH